MRRILFVGFLAIMAAALLWVLSEVEVSPVPTQSPSPVVETPTATPAAGSEQSTHIISADFSLSADLLGEGWSNYGSAGGADGWHDASQGLIFAELSTEQQPAGSNEELSVHTTRYATAVLTGYTVDPQAFHALDAYRIEGIG